MKRKLIISSVGVLVLLSIMIILNAWIGKDVQANINLAVAQYSGSPEDALLAMLQDENKSAYDRTHTAVWTLGRIRSAKAMSAIEKRRLFSLARFNK